MFDSLILSIYFYWIGVFPAIITDLMCCRWCRITNLSFFYRESRGRSRISEYAIHITECCRGSCIEDFTSSLEKCSSRIGIGRPVFFSFPGNSRILIIYISCLEILIPWLGRIGPANIIFIIFPAFCRSRVTITRSKCERKYSSWEEERNA